MKLCLKFLIFIEFALWKTVSIFLPIISFFFTVPVEIIESSLRSGRVNWPRSDASAMLWPTPRIEDY